MVFSSMLLPFIYVITPAKEVIWSTFLVYLIIYQTLRNRFNISIFNILSGFLGETHLFIKARHHEPHFLFLMFFTSSNFYNPSWSPITDCQMLFFFLNLTYIAYCILKALYCLKHIFKIHNICLIMAGLYRGRKLGMKMLQFLFFFFYAAN